VKARTTLIVASIAAIVLGGPVLFLLGESLFEWRTTGRANVKRLVAAGVLVALAPVAPHVPALGLALLITLVLAGVAAWELLASKSPRLGLRVSAAN
jgi:low temperature requirement protein LtrA